MHSELISILIPTYNAQMYIEELMVALQKQQLENNQNIEIIVVDSTSHDDTVKILKEKFPKVHVYIIDNHTFDHGGTRNYLASLAKGEYLLFMTQDAIPADDLLVKNLLEGFNKSSKIAISYARQLPKADASELEDFARKFNYPHNSQLKNNEVIRNLGIKTFFNSNVCSMYKKDVFTKLEGFPQKLILNEDMVFASKVITSGGDVYYNADAKVYHSHNYTVKQQFKRYFDIGMAFEQTAFLLKYTSNEKEGFRMIREQIKYIFSIKKIYLLLKIVIENMAKFVGYNLGKKHYLIPLKYKKKISAYMK
ncbi:glycosyltransferase family 2 protein [Priestia flexa]|uniref:glycosyltransferase family 2 protein n=1 Tax=Priestia flexa TaxID=86664 RepID=UPI003D089FAF